mmetsp:Transcript_49637/g.118118  ORF Transcript_49637/g.118118 Transcript_49637/m.118118 type:complete len:215 (+) Transcript_49637:1312-1956(+)
MLAAVPPGREPLPAHQPPDPDVLLRAVRAALLPTRRRRTLPRQRLHHLLPLRGAHGHLGPHDAQVQAGEDQAGGARVVADVLRRARRGARRAPREPRARAQPPGLLPGLLHARRWDVPHHVRAHPHPQVVPLLRLAGPAGAAGPLRGGHADGHGQDPVAEGGVLREQRRHGDALQGGRLRPDQRAHQVAQGRLRVPGPQRPHDQGDRREPPRDR